MEVLARGPLPRSYLASVTRGSFAMDAIALGDAEIDVALRCGTAKPAKSTSNGPVIGPSKGPTPSPPKGRLCRSRQAQRVRNHFSALRQIERLIRAQRPLTTSIAVRWYTALTCGLPTAQFDDQCHQRLDRTVRRLNSPHFHLRPAVEQAAANYFDLLSTPFVPSFNGILARLLIACQLGRAGVPPLLYDASADPDDPEKECEPARLLELIDRSYDALLAVG